MNDLWVTGTLFHDRRFELNNHAWHFSRPKHECVSNHLLALERKIAVDILQFIAEMNGQKIFIPDYDGINLLIHADRNTSIFTQLSQSRVESYAVKLTQHNPLPQYADSIQKSTHFSE